MRRQTATVLTTRDGKVRITADDARDATVAEIPCEGTPTPGSRVVLYTEGGITAASVIRPLDGPYPEQAVWRPREFVNGVRIPGGIRDVPMTAADRDIRDHGDARHRAKMLARAELAKRA